MSSKFPSEAFRVGESDPDSIDWRLTCEENRRKVFELPFPLVSFGEDPRAGLGDPRGRDKAAEDVDIREGGRGKAISEFEIFSR